MKARNLCSRLASREILGHKAGAGVHTIRQYYDSLHPSTSLLQVDAPAVHFCRFSPDGQYLVCFASGGQELVVYCLKGLSLCHGPASDQPGPGRPPSLLHSFDSFFQLLYRRVVATDAREQLCKDFCLTAAGGQFLLLASQTPTQTEQPQQQQQAGAAGAAGTTTQQQQQQQQAQVQQQQQQQEQGAGPGAVQGVPCVESTTLHLVRASDGEHLDSISFKHDFIHLHHNGGVSLYEDLLAVLTIRSQVTHLIQILRSGQLVSVSSIGPQCQDDDDLAIRTAEVAELNWQASRNSTATGASTSAAGPAAAAAAGAGGEHLMGRHATRVATVAPNIAGTAAVHRPPQLAVLGHAALQEAAGPQQQWHQQQQQQQVPAQAEEATQQQQADRQAQRHRRQQQASPAGQRPRHRSSVATMQQQQQQQQQPAGIGGLRQRRQQQQQQQASPGPGTGAAGAALGSHGEAGGPISGIKQRMLAYIFKTRLLRGGQSPRQQQSELRWFYRNFDMYCSLVIWRVQMLSRTHLLMDLGLMAQPEGPGQQYVPQHSLYFMVYDMESTNVVAFFRSVSDLLLPVLLRYSSDLQADVGAPLWDRFGFTAAHAALLSESLWSHHTSSSLSAASRASNATTHTTSTAPALIPALAAASRQAAMISTAQGRTLEGSSDQQQQQQQQQQDHLAQVQRRQQDNQALLRRLQAAVPGTPQALCPNPLLDPLMYTYDDKVVGPLIRWVWLEGLHSLMYTYDDKVVGPLIRQRPCPEQPIKFFLRGRGDRAAFKLEVSPSEASEPQVGRGGRRATLHLFHPVLPFVLTVIQGPNQPTQVNIHTWPLQ